MSSVVRSKEEIIKEKLLSIGDGNVNKNVGDRWEQFKKEESTKAIFAAMDEYAKQEARAEAIGFANFIKESSYIVVESEELKKEAWVDCKANEVLAHGSDWHYTKLITEHGLTTEQLYNLYLNQNNERNTKIA